MPTLLPAPVALCNEHLELALHAHTGALLLLSHSRHKNSPLLSPEYRAPLFTCRWRTSEGQAQAWSSEQADELKISREKDLNGGQAITLRFGYQQGPLAEASVRVRLPVDSALSYWSFGCTLRGEGYLEWIHFPGVMVPDDLPAKGGEGRIFWPALEGVVIEDAQLRERTHMQYQPIEYPNRGWCGYYPGCAPLQYLAYYRDNAEGLYLAAEDPEPHTKEIEYRPADDRIELILKHYPGAIEAGHYELPFEVALGVFEGDWQDAAELYRDWAIPHLPYLPPRLTENATIPDWVKDSPLVVTYPVTGVGHHSGPTEPNEYHPFTEAQPTLDRLAKATDSPLLTLLMHWEGTAPWAPPYVWPPLGGEENLKAFAAALHQRGHHLGLYCSGLAWTNTADTGPGNYQREDQLKNEGLLKEMCQGPDGNYECLICNGEGIRLGYDMCAASEFARYVTAEEVRKIANAGVDYIQLLDQNLGGAAYQCHDASHGHPPAPGPWQAAAMRDLLDHVSNRLEENGRTAPVLGCEAAAAEHLLDHLPVNDLRFHMGWWFGRPVPAFNYVFHEYVANFMGNQVEAMVLIDQEKSPDNLFLRLAYSFCAGDMLTVVLADGGQIHWSWCTKWEVEKPPQEPHLDFVHHLQAWRRGKAKPYLLEGKMLKAPRLANVATIPLHLKLETHLDYPAVLATRWLSQKGQKAILLVNYTGREQTVTLSQLEPKSTWQQETLKGAPRPLSSARLQVPARQAILLTQKD